MQHFYLEPSAPPSDIYFVKIFSVMWKSDDNLELVLPVVNSIGSSCELSLRPMLPPAYVC